VSDVLRRLALRALPGAGESVRPRLGSRFEAPPAATDLPGTAFAEAAPRAPAPAAAARVPARPGAAVRIAESSEPDPAPAADPPEVRSTIAATAAPGPHPIPADPAAAPAVEAAPADRAASAPAGSAAAGAAARAPIEAEAQADPAAYPALPHIEGGSGAEPRTPDLLLPEMRQPAETAMSGAGPAPVHRDELPPDVRISIGRIEVRAGGETRRPTPRPRSRPTLMSLEEYLGKGRSRS
jgi:hypothetical protein